MTIVVDASVVVSAFIDRGLQGTWAKDMLASNDLAAPHLLPVEAAHMLRQGSLSRRLPQEQASLAYADLVALPVELHPYRPLAARIWELRENVTAYDAWYVALAESLRVPLATVDGRLTRARGPRCGFLTPLTTERQPQQ